MQDQKILKYLKGAATDSEEKQLQGWILASSQNMKRFNLLKTQYIASTFDETTKSAQVDKKFTDFLSTLDSVPAPKSRRFIPLLKYAAMISIVIGFGYLYLNGFFIDKPEKLTISEESIRLKLNDGEVKTIASFKHKPNIGFSYKKKQIVDAKGKVLGVQSGNTIDYKHSNVEDEVLIYNTLTVPYGKRFKVILSDGTQVDLNAGTSLKYPVKFIAGNNRQVFLDGEAFFDVTKDTEHPFIVNVNELNVEVLGTQFNISSYPEDEFIRTVLVEGAVSVYENTNNAEASILEPEHQAIWNKENKSVSIEEADTPLFTSWIDGKIVFRHMSFKNIIKKLERHYNVIILSNNVVLNEETFTASFDIETIEQVLEAFDKNYAIGYTIKDNQIIIN